MLKNHSKNISCNLLNIKADMLFLEIVYLKWYVTVHMSSNNHEDAMSFSFK